MVNRSGQLSGRSYVAARMREDATDLKIAKIRTAGRDDCGHVTHICEACAHTWAWDWYLFYDRIIAGRALAQRVAVTPQEPLPDPSERDG
jgi:hypothetical protein